MDAKEIETIIEKSGNNFHYKVVEHLRNDGWFVLVSPYYNDNFTDKPREIDIIAEKEYPIGDGFGGRLGSVDVRLFVECKYITTDTVFWFDKKDIPNALNRVLTDTPLGDPRNWSMTEKHRYLENVAVGKLFATNSEKNLENEVMHKAITQSLNSLVYYKNAPTFIPEDRNHPRHRSTKAVLNYPVIVCNSFASFWKHDVNEKKAPELISNNFQLEVQYAYFDKNKNSQNEYFLIDVVSFENLDTFVKNLETKDIQAVKDKIWWEDNRA